MADVSREFLVILEPSLASEALEQARSITTVTQVLAPRLALIQAEADTIARVARIRGVIGVYDGMLPKLPFDFTAPERLFAAAWAMRQHPKTRTGDNFSWDEPGFLPPDRPPKNRS